MPQAIILIPVFAFILFLFKKLPSLLHQLMHVIIHLILVYPWVHYYLFILDRENHKITGKIFKNFSRDITWCKDPYDACKNSDAVVILTEWNQFRSPDFEKMESLMNNKNIFDGKNIFD